MQAESDSDRTIPPLPIVFARVTQLVRASGVTRLDLIDGCWTRQVDPDWWVAINGHKTDQPASSPSGMTTRLPCSVPPYTILVEYHGWVWGLIDPAGGIAGVGSGGNEDTLIAALDAAIRSLGAEPWTADDVPS